MRLLVLLLAAASLSFAQTQGRFTGIVADTTGAVIPGATVKVKNEKTGLERTVQTAETGVYFVTNLGASTYTITATSSGLSDAVYKEVNLAVGQERTLNIVMQPNTVSTEVTVSGGELAVIDTSSATVGANVSAREVAEMPINGRQVSQLYLLAPGAQTAGGGTYDNIRFSGRANQQNAIRFDGVEASSIVDASPGNLNGQTSSSFRLQASLETVQEFRVESSNYPAEYGTGTGGQISIVTKSGSNDFHGSVFEYIRNNAFDARNFFDGTNKSPLRLNQFGGSFGGAIKKDKLFFFGHYEGLRQRAGFPLVGQTPSAAIRNLPVCGTTAGRCVDAAIKPVLNAFPVGNHGATANPDFDVAHLDGRAVVNENSGSARFDYRLTDKDQVYVRWFRDDGFSTAPFDVSGSAFVQKAVAQNGVVNWQRIITPTLINELKLGYNGPKTRTNGLAPTVPGLDLSASTINITGANVLVGIGGQGASAGISIPSGQVRANSATNGRGQPYTNYSLSYVDNLSWVKGNHNVKFGGEFRQVRLYTDRLGGVTYAFSNLNAFLANTPSISVNGDLSAPSPFNNGATGNRLGKTEMFSAYAQDEFKIRPTVTLSYGLRYEYYTPMREDRNLVVLYNIVTGKLDAPGSRPFYQTSKAAFGPRLGISWAPAKFNNKTVFRIGGGYYYGPGQGEDLIQPIESDRVSTTTTGRFPVDADAVVRNFNINTATGIGVRAYAPGFRVPEKILSYTASLQQQIFGGAILQVAYVGSQGRNLFLRSIANKVVGVTMNPVTGVGTPVREFGSQFGEIDYKTTGGTDNYNSLQTTLNRRFTRGFTLGAQWTYGHSIGNSGGSNEANTAHNPYNFAMDRGNNAFDVRHSANITAMYELPFGKGRRFGSSMGRVADGIAGGWQLGGIVNARTGLPLDIRITRPDIVYRDTRNNAIVNSPILLTDGSIATVPVINVPGGGNSRDVRFPDVVAGVNPFLESSDRRFVLNPAAFTTPAPGAFGNLGRGALHGPGLSQFDLTLHKRFDVTERVKSEFRFEVYNLFNRANFSNPVVRLNNVLGTGANQLQPGQPYSATTAGSFGTVLQTVESAVGLGAQRQIQLSLRFSF
ncbi:MAG TPA: carboxypeptidase regulatory-like domain-containing protein [Bryobacteraceae bacterium]|nr:carboxypeptidase regulatory-like domain-containing protein [Bryobacteraceae bacterium]